MPNKEALLELTLRPYDEYNAVLAEIKKQLGPVRTKFFEKNLALNLPHMTGRQAFRLGILAALGASTIPAVKKNTKKLTVPAPER